MKILIACEESQVLCKAFRERGHEAYSNDIKDCSGGCPQWHLKRDCRELIYDDWDMIIAHPPCTYLCISGNSWFNVEKYGEKALDRIKKREEAIDFFLMFTKLNCPRVVIENPVGVMSTIYRKPDQIINPYQFGEGAMKRTCLWLKGVPKLIPTKIVEKEYITLPNGEKYPKWSYDTYRLPAKERAQIRSRTFYGIGLAMAEQWG